MTLPAITIENPLPPILIALSTEAQEQIEALTLAVHEARITDQTSWHAADALVKQASDLERQIDRDRKAITKPIDELKSAVMDAARQPLAPLKEGIAKLGMAVRAWQVEQERLHAARVEALRQEAARLQAIEEERARAAYQQAADQLPPDDPPPVLEHAPVVIRPAVIPPPPKATSVRAKVERHVVIVDDALVPVTIAGACIRPVDLAACKRLLVAGVQIPGMELVETESFARKGA